ncbi:hypothetical protein [Parafrankia colletiae]|nr:hypothetical protein [Parafrankia colletiae]
MPTAGSLQFGGSASGAGPRPAASTTTGPAGRAAAGQPATTPTRSVAARMTQAGAGGATAPAPPPRAGTPTPRQAPAPPPPVPGPPDPAPPPPTTPYIPPMTQPPLPVLTMRLVQASGQSDPDPSCVRFSIAYANSGAAATTTGTVAVYILWWVGVHHATTSPNFVNAAIPGGLRPGQSITESYRRCASGPVPAGGYLVVHGLGSAIYN